MLEFDKNPSVSGFLFFNYIVPKVISLSFSGKLILSYQKLLNLCCADP